MSQIYSDKKIPLECYKNGKRVILPFATAHAKLWAANYGWIVPLDFYRWQIDDFIGESEIFRQIKGRAMQFGYLVHIQENPVTLDQMEKYFNNGETLGKDIFVAWAARFNRIIRRSPHFRKGYQKYYPFYYIEFSQWSLGIHSCLQTI